MKVFQFKTSLWLKWYDVNKIWVTDPPEIIVDADFVGSGVEGYLEELETYGYEVSATQREKIKKQLDNDCETLYFVAKTLIADRSANYTAQKYVDVVAKIRAFEEIEVA